MTLSWKKIRQGVYHAPSPWGLYTIDGHGYGRNRWTVTYPDGDFGMVDSLAEAKAWAAQDSAGRTQPAAHARKRASTARAAQGPVEAARRRSAPISAARGPATRESIADRDEAVAFGTKWAEDRFRADPDYAAFTLDMVWIDPDVVPSAKKREALKSLICTAAARRWRALRDQTAIQAPRPAAPKAVCPGHADPRYPNDPEFCDGRCRREARSPCPSG